MIARGAGPGSDKAAALVDHYLRENLGKDERFEVLEPSVALGNPRRDRALRQFQLAEDLLQKARQAYDGLDLDVAERHLRGALLRYERWAPYLGDLRRYADALMLLGAVRILKGDERGGTRALEHAIGVFPGAEPDTRVFNPAMRVQFSQAAARLSTAPSGTLSVASSPGYASVFVDNRFVGVSPLPVEGLTPGKHILRVERAGHLPWGKAIEVMSHAETHENAALRPAVHFEQYDRLADAAVHALESEKSDERVVGLRALGELFDADAVFFARVRLDGERVRLNGELFELHGKKERMGEHVFAYDTRVDTYEHETRSFLQQGFGFGDAMTGAEKKQAASDESSEAGDKALVHAGGRKGCGLMSCPTLKKVTYGSLVGLGGAAAVLGGVEWFLAKRDHTAWRKTVQVASNQAGLRVAGYNHALAGDVLVGVGLSGVLAGIIVAAAWHPSLSVEDVASDPAGAPTDPRRGAQAPSVQWHLAAVDGGTMVGSTWHF